MYMCTLNVNCIFVCIQSIIIFKIPYLEILPLPEIYLEPPNQKSIGFQSPSWTGTGLWKIRALLYECSQLRSNKAVLCPPVSALRRRWLDADGSRQCSGLHLWSQSNGVWIPRPWHLLVQSPQASHLTLLKHVFSFAKLKKKLNLPGWVVFRIHD